MSTKFLKYTGLIAVIAILALSLMAFTNPQTVSASGVDRQGGPGGRGGNGGRTQTGGVALTPLSDAEKDTLNQAILEEYGALNLYKSVISQLGNVLHQLLCFGAAEELGGLHLHQV